MNPILNRALNPNQHLVDRFFGKPAVKNGVLDIDKDMIGV